MHRRVATETRRAREWQGPTAFPWRTLPSPRGREWLELVKYWNEGGTGPVWFLAEPRRTDLALVDPASHVLRGSLEQVDHYLDTAVVEAFNWDVLPAGDAVARATPWSAARVRTRSTGGRSRARRTGSSARGGR